MPTPIIYLTFANQQDNHLPLLSREKNEIKDALRPLEAQEFIAVMEDDSFEFVIKNLPVYSDRIAVFHFSGHAEGQSLLLEDTGMLAKGLATQLGQMKELQVVFLNGCSTFDQVELLLAAGIKAVIATSVPIEDTKAQQFSKAFYFALANKHSVKRAFEHAKSYLESTYRQLPPIEIFRGLKTREQKNTGIEWGLYLHPSSGDAVLNWRLPYSRTAGLPDYLRNYIVQSFKTNLYIALVLDEMVKYNKDIRSQMEEVVGGQIVKKDSSTYLDIVIQNFPWLIGSQIQLLRQKNSANKERLEQLVSTYVITSLTLFYILLSNLWDERRSSKLSLPQGFLQDLFPTADSLLRFDYFQALLKIYEVMKTQKAYFFVPEMENFCAEVSGTGTLNKAWQFMQGLRSRLDQLDPALIENQCLQAEQALALVLMKSAFLAVYRPLTIRKIEIDNPRYGKVSYEINMGPLNAIVSTSLSLYEDADKRRKDTYSNCRSVVITTNEYNIGNALNLSPFIIDKNTFLNNNAIDLFVFGYEKDGVFLYFAIKHSIFIAIKNEKGTDIIDTEMTLEDFQEGRNIRKFVQEEEDDFGFADAFGIKNSTVEKTTSPKVFDLLEEQWERFKTDFT